MKPGPETEAGIGRETCVQIQALGHLKERIAQPVADLHQGVPGRWWGAAEAVNKTNRTHSLGEFTVGEGRHNQDNQEGTNCVVEIGQ